MGVLQANHGAHQLVLNIEGQAGGNAVGVILVGAKPFRLQKNLVAVLASTAVDLVFHAGAIAWADAVNLAGEHRAAVKTGADDLVGALIGVGHPAGHLLGMGDALAHEAEHRHRVALAAGHAVTRLALAF